MRSTTLGWFAVVAVSVVSFGIVGCSGAPQTEGEEPAEHASAEETADLPEGAEEHVRAEEAGEHDEGREGGGEHGEAGHDEEGEESGEYIGRGDTWDNTRGGARLILSFDPASGAFVGTVENTAEQTLCDVRVEVHLSTGTELGPTERTDIPPGEKIDVELATGGEAFDTWTAHPEVSACNGG